MALRQSSVFFAGRPPTHQRRRWRRPAPGPGTGGCVRRSRPRTPAIERHGEPDHREGAEEGRVGEQVGQQGHQRGADEGAPEALAAAQHHAEQQDHRQLVDEALRLQVLEVEGVERPGQAAEPGAEGEGRHLVAVGADPHGVGGDGAVAQRLEGPPPLRGEQVAHRHPDHAPGAPGRASRSRAASSTTPEERRAVSESPWAPSVSHSSSLRAVVVRAVKLRVARANCGPSRRRAGRASSAPTTVQTQAGRRPAPAGMPTPQRVVSDARGVGAEPEEGGLRQVHLPEVADGDVQADEEDAVDGQQGEQPERVGVVHRQRDRRQQGEQADLGAADEEEALEHGGLRPSG